MNSVNQRLISIVALTLLVFASVAKASEDKIAAARQAAQAWLALVDKGQYEESWSDAASVFQGQISSSDWTDALAGARAPLGDVVSRELSSSDYTTRLPGVPDGEYVVLRYETSFASKAKAVEIITPMLDDGQWKVTGYYIQ